MHDIPQVEMEEALRSLASMISRSEKGVFRQGTPQHTLQKNRVAALRLASRLIEEALSGGEAELPAKEELNKARAPIALNWSRKHGQ